MADREGLGNLPIFDTEIRTSRELIAQEQRQEDDYQYIIRMYSALAREILDQIEDACDQMEYDGSPMFDCYPDRIIIGRMVQKICGERCNDPYYNALVQVMLCKEMRCRRNRRDCHKKRILH